jgi:hypothetical protein
MAKSAKQFPRSTHLDRKRVATATGTHRKTQSDDGQPHLDFLNRYKGTLPEKIAESELETLNSGLGFLFAWMREARRLYYEGGDNGRAAALIALEAMWQFIMLFNVPLAGTLHMPILNLQNALQALEENNVLPILKPVARSGRAASSHARLTLKGKAAGKVKLLVEAGLDRRRALQVVAKTLAEQGVRPERGSGAITANTVRHWCDEVAADVGRRGTAAMAYDSMQFTGPQPPEVVTGATDTHCKTQSDGSRPHLDFLDRVSRDSSRDNWRERSGDPELGSGIPIRMDA